MDWKKYAQKKNAETYVIPSPWESREKVAESLGCSPEKVDDNLRAGLNSKEIQKQSFAVWDSKLERKVMTVAYAHVSKLKKPDGSADALEQARKLKQQGKTYAEIGAAIGVSPDAARGILRRASSA